MNKILQLLHCQDSRQRIDLELTDSLCGNITLKFGDSYRVTLDSKEATDFAAAINRMAHGNGISMSTDSDRLIDETGQAYTLEDIESLEFSSRHFAEGITELEERNEKLEKALRKVRSDLFDVI